MGIPFTLPMGFLLTMTIGFLLTIALAIQLTISTDMTTWATVPRECLCWPRLR